MRRWIALALLAACAGCGARTHAGGIDAAGPDAGDDASEPEDPACTPEPGPPLSSLASSTRVTFEGQNPMLASKEGRLAVAWTSAETNELRFAVLDADGREVIGPLGASREAARLADVEPTDGGWALLWWTRATMGGTSDLRLTRVSDGGRFVAADNLVATARDAGGAALAWPSDDGVLLAWSAALPRGSDGRTVSVARLNATLDSLESRTVTHPGDKPSAVASPSGYGLAWLDGTDVLLQRLDDDADPASDPRRITGEGNAGPTVLAPADQLAVAYGELRGGAFSTHLAHLGAGGAPEVAALSPPGQHAAFVHADTDGRGVAAAWQSMDTGDDGFGVDFARIERAGATPARSTIPLATAGDALLPHVAWMGDRWAAAWSRFADAYTVIVAIDCKP